MTIQKVILIVLGTLLSLSPLCAQKTSLEDRQKKALEILNRAIAEHQRKTGKPAGAAPARSPATEQSYQEVERQYLDGKITTKQFQKYIKDHQAELSSLIATPSSVAPQVEPLPDPVKAAIPSPKDVGPSEGNEVKPAGAYKLPNKEDKATPEQKTTLAEIEAKMEELQRLKEAREQALLTNAVTATNVVAKPAAPQTKRERMNDLLRLLIDGKISDADYQEKRAKIVAEPD